MNNKNLQSLYNSLKRHGYEMSSFDEFKRNMADDNKRRQGYDAISKEFNLPGYDQFSKDMGFGAAEPTPQPQPQQQPKVSAPLAEGVRLPNASIQSALGQQSTLEDMQQPIAQPQGGEFARQQAEQFNQAVNANRANMFKQPALRDDIGGIKAETYNPDAVAAMERAYTSGPQTFGEQVDEKLNRAEQRKAQILDELGRAKKKERDSQGVFLRAFRDNDIEEDVDAAIGMYLGKEKQDEFRSVEASISQLTDAKKAKELGDADVSDNKAGNTGLWGFIKGAGRGFASTAFDARTWDFGFDDLSRNTQLLSAIEKYEKGEQLTQAEDDLLTAASINAAAQSYLSEVGGYGTAVGGIVGETLPYTLQFAINPISGTSKGIAKYGAKKFGVSAMKKGIAKKVVKAALRTAGDVAAATGIAATTGIINVAAGTHERMIGNVMPTYDEFGYVQYGGREGAEDSWGTAAAKSAGSEVISNYTEMLGEHFAPLLNKVGKGLSNVASKNTKLQKVTEVLSEIKGSEFSKGFREFLDRTKWHGSIGEYFEEVANNIADATFIGDMQFDTSEQGVFNLRNNIETFLGVAMMGSAVSTVNTAGYAVDKSHQLKTKRTLNKQSVLMGEMLGDKWTGIKDQIDNAEDDQLVSLLTDITYSNDYTAEQKKGIWQYAAKLKASQGANIARLEQQIGGEFSPQINDVIDGFEAGYMAPLSEAAAIKAAYDDAVSAYEQKYEPIGDNLNDAISEAIYVGDQTRADALVDIAKKKAAFEGIKNQARDNMQDRIDNSNAHIDRLTNQGMVIQATLKEGDKPVFITSGAVVSYDDGTVDTKNSSDFLVGMTPEGEVITFGPGQLLRIDSATPSDAMKYYTQQEILREEAETINNVDNGTVNVQPGETYSLVNAQGEQIDVSILQNNGDGTFLIDDGLAKRNVPAEELQQLLQQSMVVNARTLREQQEAQRQQKSVQNQEVEGFAINYNAIDNATIEDYQKILGSDGILAGLTNYEINLYSENPNLYKDKIKEGVLLTIDYLSGKIGSKEYLIKLQNYPNKDDSWINTVTEERISEEANNVAQGYIPYISRNAAPVEQGTTLQPVEQPVIEQPAAEKTATEQTAQQPQPIMVGDELINADGDVGEITAIDDDGVIVAWERPDGSRYVSRVSEQDALALKNVFPEEMTESQTVVPQPQAEEATAPSLEELQAEEQAQTTAEQTPESVIAEMQDFEPEERQVIVNNNIQAAEQAYNDILNAKPVPGMDIAAFRQEKAEWQANVEQAKANLDFWNNVNALLNAPVAKESVAIPAETQPEAPISATAEAIAQAEAETNTEPTEAQKDAGNYKKGHVVVDGMNITIEQPKGSVRRGTDANGKAWETVMQNTYGYIRGTQSVDGDHIDIFLSDNPETGNVYVVDQVNNDGSFDEHKIMYGFNSVDEARAAYLSNYEEGWQGLGNITEVSKEDFKKWLDSSTRKTKPFAEYASTPEPAVLENDTEGAPQDVAEPWPTTDNLQSAWQQARKEVGMTDDYTLPNGETIEGVYVLTEAESLSPSHNPNAGFGKTKGFPVDENGNTINDRDYEFDKEAQAIVKKKAQDYDQRAVQTPVIVTGDGIVISGNDRTMSGQMAAEMGTDGKYINYITNRAAKFGFTAEQVSSFTHPRIVFVPTQPIEYNAKTFAKFNAEDKKTQNKTEQAVKLGKTISNNGMMQIAEIINNFETMSDLYASRPSVMDIVSVLQREGVIVDEQRAQLFDGNTLSTVGKDLLENVLVGGSLSEESVRSLNQMKDVRGRVVKAILQLLTNRTFGEYSLTSEISDAIEFLYKARKSGVKDNETTESFARQPDLFGGKPSEIYSATVQMIANALNKSGNLFKNFLNQYNERASSSASGQLDMFTGDVENKEQIITNILEVLYGKGKRTFTTQKSSTDSGSDEDSNASVGETERTERGIPEEAEVAESVKSGYSVSPAQYATKRGKILDMQLVKFDRELTKEELRSSKELAKGLRGWWDSSRGGFMMRSEADAQTIVDALIPKETTTTVVSETTYTAKDEDIFQMAERIAREAEETQKRQKKSGEGPVSLEKWKQMGGDERMEEADKRPLTREEIENAATDEVLKSNALDYLKGNQGMIQSISYLKVYEDVRYSNGNLAADSGAANSTQLDEAHTGSQQGLDGTTGGPRGVSSELLDSEQSEGTLPGMGGHLQHSADSEERLAPDAGERSDIPVSGEEQPVGGRPVRSRERGGSRSGDSDGRDGQPGRAGGSYQSAGDDRKRGIKTERGRNSRNGGSQSIGEDIDAFLASAMNEFEGVLEEFRRAGKEELSASLIGLSNRQLEVLPRLIASGAKVGYAYIRKGVYNFAKWAQQMRAVLGAKLVDSGLSDNEVDAFIREMWKSRLPMDGKTHTLEEWAGILGKEELRKKVGASLAEKRKAQQAAEAVSVINCDRGNIAETLPFLLPQQQDDVLKAETQFFDESHNDREHAFGKGYMFTNGTGTGKTYTGLGIVKRFIKQGKGRILILTPSQTKVGDWIKDAANLDIDLKDLDAAAKARKNGATAITEKGDGAVVTTYANFRQNKALLEDLFDLIVYDESHRLLENKGGIGTAGAMQHYKISNRNEQFAFLRLQEINPVWNEYQSKLNEFNEKRDAHIERLKKERGITNELTYKIIDELPPVLNGKWTAAKEKQFPELYKLQKEISALYEKYDNEIKPELEQQAQKNVKHTKVVFLSATPFNTRENLDYTEGYIFSYPENEKPDGYSAQSPRSQFYLEHFGAGYRWRYHRLESTATNPEAVSKQEVEFSDYLQHTLQTMSGRIIDSPFDYSRDFPTVTLDKAEEFNNAMEELSHEEATREAYHKVMGDYNYAGALFESMKVAQIIPRLKEHLARGRKAVVFHRRVETKKPLVPPFHAIFEEAVKILEGEYDATKKAEKKQKIAALRRKYSGMLEWEQTLDLRMPREQLADAFGHNNVLFFSGQESEKAKKKAVKDFNSDTSGKNLIVIQEASGKEGISLHDTTGNHQRVLVTLALPQSPITALQIEGRIYRIGNKSNAIFEYPLLGLNTELMLFGQKFNQQVSTTENLALGSQARNLRESFARGVEEHSGDVDIDGQGVGGKEFDAPSPTEKDAFDNAVLDYYTNQRLTGKRDRREGTDYYPTPEPLGFMMGQWGRIGEGESVLEPSAGHGAIARYVPRENQLTAIEPSQSLFSKLQIKAGGNGRKFKNIIFEDYNVVNKHDVVLMNPPFGTGGRLAVDHIAKAFQHLEEGGRIVAIVPRGAADKKFDKWYDEQKNAVVTAEIDLPDITFERAGTSINCRVVVIDKVTNDKLREAAAAKTIRADLSEKHYEKIEDFFEDIRNISVPERTIDRKAKLKKKAASTARELRAMKGIRSVRLDESGLYVSGSGVWASIEWGERDGDSLTVFLAGQYRRFRDNYDYAVRNERRLQEAVYGEMKDLACKLAGMTEDEMQRYIKIIQREGDGAYTDAEVSMANDPISKVLGRNRFSKRKQAEFAERERERMVGRVNELAEKLNLTNVDVVTDANTLSGPQSRAKGFYNTRTGRITIVIPNHVSSMDVEQTLLHEAVAHYGLRRMFGKDFDAFLDSVYEAAIPELRQRIDALVEKYGDKRTATEEYIASLAESTDFDNFDYGWWSKVKENFVKMLNKLGFNFEPGDISDNELRYLLWRSNKALREPGAYNIRDMAEDIAMQSTLQVGNYAPFDVVDNAVADVRYRGNEQFNEEENAIIEKAKKDGTYMLAPNGRPTNLTEHQWVQVRTDAFKKWFGDWEKAARIEKLRHSKPVDVIFKNEYSLNRKDAKEWLKENVRGKYTNIDTGDKVEVSKVGINEVTAHGSQDEAHLKSLVSIPQMIEKSIFIDEIPNTKDNDKYDSYRYYVCGLNIDGTDYTAKIVVGVKGDNKYYDHRLTEIEKGTLINNLNGLSNSVAENQNPSISEIKDTKLVSLLQANASKVVDENGEPLVVYHGTKSFNKFDETYIDKEKALNYLHLSAPIAEASNNQELVSATNIVKNFENPTVLDGEIVASVGKLSDELHTPVRIVHNMGELPDDSAMKRALEKGRKIKGWFSPSTNEVYLYLPNAESVEDARRTVFHEAVGHKGLREMLGGDFDTFLLNVYSNASSAVRKRIAVLASKNGWDISLATEEYLAMLSERGFEDAKERSFFQSVKDTLIDLLRKAGIRLGFKLSDKELRYILWRSYQMQRNKGIVGEAENVAMQMALQVGNFTPEKDVLFRDSAAAVQIRDDYEKKVSGFLNNLDEAYHDYLRSVRITQDLIEKKSGSKIQDFEDVYKNAMRKSSVDAVEIREFHEKIVEPFLKHASKMIDGKRIDGQKMTSEHIDKYLHLLHAPERNEVFARRDARRIKEEEIQKLDKQKAAGLITPTDYNTAKSEAEAKEQDNYNKFRENDYSGLTEMFGEGKTVQELEALAKEYTDKFEKIIGQEDIDILQNDIKQISHFTLEKTYESGIISRNTMEELETMFEHYVPLRGFKDDVASDVYEYVGSEANPGDKKVVKAAKGRKSIAESPIANLLVMGTNAIVSGNKNKIVKMSLLNLAENHPTDLLTVSSMWYEKQPDGTWEPKVADIPENATAKEVVQIVEAFEEDMKVKAKTGMAKRRTGKSDIPLRVLNKRQEMQHAVRVMRNGTEYVVYINGNPKLAQAVNGLLNIDSTDSPIWKTARAFNGFFSRINTSWSPEFIARNLARDIVASSITAAVKEGPKYTAMFEKNLMNSLSAIGVKGVRRGKFTGMYNLYMRYKNGKLDMNNPRDRYFHEFIKNGGETGITQMLTIDSYKNKMKKMVDNNGFIKFENAAKAVSSTIVDGVDFINKGVENACRFSAYMTSRQMGKSITESIYDAKEISVNFNRKGSGAMGNRLFVTNFMFFNAAMQSLFKQLDLFKKYPAKMSGLAFGLSSIAFLMALVCINAGDDGDDEEMPGYFDINPFTRRGNFMVPVGDGKFAKIPLAYEVAVWYGMGDILATSMLDEYNRENTFTEIGMQLASMLPLDVVEGKNIMDPERTFLEQIGKAFIPSYAKPFAEAWGYEQDFLGRPINNRSDYNEHKPEWQRANKNTSQFFIGLSKGITRLTGGRYNRKGWIDNVVMNPGSMEHLAKGMTGGLGTFVINTSKTVRALMGEEDYKDVFNVPFARSFYMNLDNDYYRNRRINERWYFYDKEYESLWYDINSTLKDTSIPVEEKQALIDSYQRNGEYEKVGLFRGSEDVDGFMKISNRIDNAIREAESNGDENTVEELYDMRAEFRRKAVNMLDSITEEHK